MFCTKCGTNNKDTDVYCKNCGVKLVKPVSNNTGSQSTSNNSGVAQKHHAANIMLMAGGAIIVIAILVVIYLKFASTKIGEEDFVSVDGSSSELTYDISDEDMYAISLREDIDGTTIDKYLSNDANALSDSTNTALAESDNTSVDMFASSLNEPGATITEQDMPEEAVYTGVSDVSTLAGAKLLKEQTRAQNKESLMEMIQNEDLTEEARKEAVNSMIALTETAQKESDAQMLLEAKGYTQNVVSISGDSVDVMVEADNLTEEQTAQIIDIVQRKTEIAAENIIITVVPSE